MDALGALKLHRNNAGITAAGDLEVVFQMLLLAPEDDIDSGVAVVDSYARIKSKRFAQVGPAKVVGLADKLGGPGYQRIPIAMNHAKLYQ